MGEEDKQDRRHEREEEERGAKPPSSSTPLTHAQFLSWKRQKDALASDRKAEASRKRQEDIASGLVQMNGRELFLHEPWNESVWAETENWLQQRHAEIYPYSKQKGNFKILGYQWHTLRFNDDTRQSTAKVMAAYRQSEPGSVFLRQEAHCLAVPYIKSMVSAGLTSITSCDYDLESCIRGKKTMKILCVGHGGGSLPLFLAHKIPGAIVHIVEIDPLIIATSTRAMGFPKFSIVNLSGERAQIEADPVDQVMWKGTHERLFLYESDAEQFIVNSYDIYDMVFVDAYDGDDVFPHKLWDPDSTFLKNLEKCLHPEHGTVVVNLHSDTDLSSHESSQSILPMRKYVWRVCKAYKKVLLECEGKDSGLSFTVSGFLGCVIRRLWCVEVLGMWRGIWL